MIFSAGAQSAWVPCIPWNQQIFESYEMEPMDFEEKKGFIKKVATKFVIAKFLEPMGRYS